MIKYYIIPKDTFKEIDKQKVSYLHKSIDRTKYIIGYEGVFEYLHEATKTFDTVNDLSVYTHKEPEDWFGDNDGLDVDMIEENEYLVDIDDSE
jgi:hypothetical protein